MNKINPGHNFRMYKIYLGHKLHKVGNEIGSKTQRPKYLDSLLSTENY